MTRVTTSELGLEVRATSERMMNFSSGEWALGVRVKYRAAGARRWQSFLLWPDEGQTVDELLELTGEAADKVYSGHVRDQADDEFTT